MNQLINYLLEVSVCWGVFYLFYIAVLHDQKAYQYNRFYLLASLLLGLVIPSLNIPIGVAATTTLSSSYFLLDPMLATTATASASSETGFQWEWQYGVLLVYGMGALAVGVYYFRQFLSVLWAIRLSKPQLSPQKRYQLLHTQGRFPTSSFFQYLLWDNTQQLSVSEIHQMMAHEETHIQQKHSYDITYITLLKIVFWFHPLVYLYDRALTENHEFAADAGALQHPTGDRRIYARLLAKQTVASLQWTVVNHFYKSKTLKRIKMMEKRNKTLWYRYALIAPLVGALLLVFSCQPDTEEMEQQAIAESYEDVTAQLEEVGGQLQQLTNKYFENPGGLMDAIREESEKSIGSEPPLFDEVRLKVFQEAASASDYQKFEKLTERQKALQEKLIGLPDAAGIFTVVENQPSPTGGMKTFYQHIMQELQYPKEARQKGIEGKVFVQFVVNEYGELTDFQALKGIGAGCDEAAIEALKSAPEWNPGTTDGKAVPVRMVLPVTFKLGDGDGQNSSSKLSSVEEDNAPNKMEETVVVGYQPKN